MPVWRIFMHPDTFTPIQRAALAKDVTELYQKGGLPAFYVNVLFIPLEKDNYYIGGVSKKNFVRICIEQIARQMPDGNTEKGMLRRQAWMDRINEVREMLFPPDFNIGC
jgi:phenylpyruvate tautomerase PptA (4-oxalocrotonate tautomerase family)